jgi:two-component system, OmpR family, KDP operon response regulator KdpE
MTESSPLILLVEDEPQLRRFLRPMLRTNGYRLVEAETAREGVALAHSHNPDIVLLDLGLPDGDGVEVTRQLRAWSQVPIIIISARGKEQDKVEALDAGADDYLIKPFGSAELLARLRVAVRHAARGVQATPLSTHTFGDVRVDLERRTVHRGEAEVHLTPHEYKLLVTLIRNAGKVVTHRLLLREVWGPGAQQNHYLRVYMGQLRQKLEDDPARPRWLATEAGVGYRLRDEPMR